jgi:hypothetical protein
VVAYPGLVCDREANSPTCAAAHRRSTPRSGSVVAVVTHAIETHPLVCEQLCGLSKPAARRRPLENPALPKGRDAAKPVLLEREGVHSCTEKAIDYWRIAAIAASTPI